MLLMEVAESTGQDCFTSAVRQYETVMMSTIANPTRLGLLSLTEQWARQEMANGGRLSSCLHLVCVLWMLMTTLQIAAAFHFKYRLDITALRCWPTRPQFEAVLISLLLFLSFEYGSAVWRNRFHRRSKIRRREAVQAAPYGRSKDVLD